MHGAEFNVGTDMTSSIAQLEQQPTPHTTTHQSNLFKEMETPRYLFRSWDESSNGTNSKTLFEPALTRTSKSAFYDGLKYDFKSGSFKEQLKEALYDKKDRYANPFVFTTCSFQYAIQHSIRKSKNAMHVHIGCIDTWSARTKDGKPVDFRSAKGLLSELDMTLEARYSFVEMNFADVFLTTDTIVPRKGSFFVSFEDLRNEGLFQLYPEWSINARLACPGLEKPVVDLRRIWFRAENDCKPEEMSLAAKLTGLFKPVDEEEEQPCFPTHMLSWFLALKNQKVNGTEFFRWLSTESKSVAEESFDETTEKIGIPEFDKFLDLNAVMKQREFRIVELTEHETTIPDAHIDAQIKHYKEERKRVNAPRNEERREKRLEEKCLSNGSTEESPPKKRKVIENGVEESDLSTLLHVSKKVLFQLSDS